MPCAGPPRKAVNRLPRSRAQAHHGSARWWKCPFADFTRIVVGCWKDPFSDFTRIVVGLRLLRSLVCTLHLRLPNASDPRSVLRTMEDIKHGCPRSKRRLAPGRGSGQVQYPNAEGRSVEKWDAAILKNPFEICAPTG
jgi:hypothetical protein